MYEHMRSETWGRRGMKTGCMCTQARAMAECEDMESDTWSRGGGHSNRLHVHTGKGHGSVLGQGQRHLTWAGGWYNHRLTSSIRSASL
jgi:hypothetical protein